MDPRAAVNIYRRDGGREAGRCGLLFNSWSGGATWPHKLYYQGVVSLSRSSGIYRRNSGVHDRRSTFLQPLSIWPSFTRSTSYAPLRSSSLVGSRQGLCFFLPSGLPGWGRRATNSELPSAEYLGSIFVFLGSKRAFGSDRRTEMEGPFLNANLRPPPPPLLQMRR